MPFGEVLKLLILAYFCVHYGVKDLETVQNLVHGCCSEFEPVMRKIIIQQVSSLHII